MDIDSLLGTEEEAAAAALEQEVPLNPKGGT